MEFKWIKGYEGIYEVSNTGIVRSVDRVVNGRPGVFQNIKGRVLSQNKDRYGYFVVNLSKDGKGKNFTVHRLVALSFLDKVDDFEVVNHKDGNKENNSVENLEWVNVKLNTQHAYDNGLAPTGEENYNAKFTNEQVLSIRSRKSLGESKQEVYKDYTHVKYATFTDLWIGRSYKHCGSEIQTS